MSHYYTDNRELPHNRKEKPFRFSGLDFIFESDNGVFSKEHVDTGTQILLNVLKNQPLSGNVLDLGCGYGVIGVVIAKLFQDTSITMVDINPRAVQCCVSNAQRNGVSCNILVSDGFKELTDDYNAILLNPPIRAGKAVIYKLFEDSASHLKKGASLYIVMRKQHGALSAIKKLETLFSEVKTLDRDRGFHVIQALKSN